MGDKIWQEFYCNDCNGFIRVKLNMALNHGIQVVCPQCGRRHPRFIRDGVIVDGGGSAASEEICPPISAYSKEAWTKKLQNTNCARNGEVIKEKDDLIPERSPEADQMIKERWFEIYGG